MGRPVYLTILINILLLAFIQSLPLPETNDAEFCEVKGLVNFDSANDYFYEYKTKTKLWINNISEESKSLVDLTAKARLRNVRDCTYQLILDEVSVTGETVNQADINELITSLQSNPSFFKLNKLGQLHPTVKFVDGDSNWSKNIKRGVISTLQTLSACCLNDYDEDSLKKSTLIYEYDVLGRCRTTYSVNNATYVKGSNSFKLEKKKDLHSCSLNSTVKTADVQYVRYRNLPEFYQGQLFVEHYECDSQVKDGVVSEVECEEKSTYKIGAKGDKGAQAVVKSNLKFLESKTQRDKMASGLDEASPSSITIDLTDETVDDSEFTNFDLTKYFSELCSDLEQNGLDNQHSNNFRRLVRYLRSKSAKVLIDLFDTFRAQCEIAGETYAQALLFGDSESTIEAVLQLLDKDAFSNQRYITEYPILTALTRTQKSSVNVISKLRNYISSKKSDFPYLRKLYLVFSSLIRVHCQRNECSQSDLNNWSSLFVANLGTNCADSSNQELVTTSLKAIGNVGYFANKDVLVKCASNKENSLEVRINAIQAFRDFSCGDYMKELTAILTDPRDDDSEVEINVFLVLAKCIETEEFQVAADTLLAKFLAEEDDIQVLTFIIDYAKEHGLTSFLNPVLANPKIKERFSVNFKELSWNNYRNRYSVIRDSGYELETSVIYASKSWIPRSIRFNVTLHAFGMSINFIDVTLRLQGLTDVLKGVIVDKITSDEFLRQIAENPDNLADILQSLADKLKFEPESPTLSLSIRTYGSDVYYSELNTIEKLRTLALFLRNRDKILYSQINTIKNYYLVKSRVRQPLMNGLEFNSFFDITGGLLILKRSSKTDLDEKREFSIKNFYSLSGSINKRLEVLLTPKSRLSLKKVVYLNARVNLNIEGSKQGDHATYKIKLPENSEQSMFTLDGRFYKLSKDNKYVDLTDFKVERHSIDKCTSPKFHNAIGFDLCLTVSRPAIGGIGEVFKTLDLSNSFRPYEDDDDDDDDDDNDHDHDNDGKSDHDKDDHEVYYKRPKLTLSGPYHYNVVLKNTENYKSILLEFNVEKAEDSYDLTGTLKAEKPDGFVEDKFILEYKRKKSYTNLGFERKVDFELKIPTTNEVRLKLNTLLAYKKQELFNAYFNLDNKILREFHLEFEVKREKNENNVIGEYKLEAILDSHIREHRKYKLYADIVPEGKNIKSYLVIERKDQNTNQEKIKLIDGLLTLNHGDSEADADYDVYLQIETYTQKKVNLNGHISASLFDSNIDLSLEFSNTTLAHPINIRLGHHFDGSSKSKSYVELSAKLPNTPLNHGAKILFLIEIPKLNVNYLEFQLRTPNSGETPYSVHVGRTIDAESGKSEYEGGISNFEIDLSRSIANSLAKVDGNNILKSFLVKFARTYDSQKKSYDHQLIFEKNGNEFAKLNSNLYGSFSELRKQLNRVDGEVAAQELGASIKLKVMEHTGSLSGKLALEASRARSFHKFNFEFDTVNLFRIFLKVISVRTNFIAENSKIEASHEIVRLGELRTFSLKSTNGQLRTIGSEKQFDISYEKKLSNGESFKSTGVATYSFNDFKNFLIKFDVPNHYDFNIQAENSKNPDLSLGIHSLGISLNHRDYQPYGRKFSVRVENVTDLVNNIHARNVVVNLLLKEGQPDKLNDVSSLKYAIELNTKNKFYFPENKRTLLDGDNNLWIKISSVNYESRHKVNRRANLADNTISTEGDATINLPTIFSEPGKTSTIKANFVYNENKNTRTASLVSEFETDHKIVSSLVKKSKLTLNRQVDSATNIGVSVVNIDFTNSASDSTKNINTKFESDCITGGCKSQKISFTQNILTSWNSVLATGKTINLDSCSYERRFERVKESKKYLLDTALVIKCGDSALINGVVYVRREINNQELPETELRLEGESDFYFNRRKINLKHRKFSPENGLVSAGFESARLNTQFSTQFEYNRKLDELNRLVSGEYVLKTSTGNNYNKVCTLNIESKENYYNSLNCRVQTPSIAETLYGYALKVNEVKEILFGRRSLELNVNIPGRTLRFDYDGYGTNPLNTNDDDEDENNEREFNGTFRYFWDYAKDQNKLITVNLKRDNFALGQSKTSVQITPSTNVNLKSINLEVRRHRKSNETAFNAYLSYELTNGKTNRLDADVVLKSDLNSNFFRIEENLQRPPFNVRYESKFNKYNGRLLYSNFRAARLVSFRIVKDDVDPRSRRISLELNAPSDEYTLERLEENSNGVYKVVSKLFQNSAIVSTLTSKFDSHYNLFTAELDGSKVGNKYVLSFNLYNQSVASASIVKNGNIELVKSNIALVKDSNFNNLVLTLKWNRFWREIQLAALGKTESQLIQNDNFNSYFGDVYAVLSEDLKPTFDFSRAQREGVLADGNKLILILADFYSNVSPTLKGIFASRLSQTKIATQSEEPLPFYKRVYHRYNELARELTRISLVLRKYSKTLSTYVPRLPVLEYNPPQTDKTIRPFDNNLKVSRPTLNSDNLYQFYAEQRNYMKKAGELVLSIKGNLLRDLNVLRFKSLINKYKYRSLQDFTLVGVVYNKRNVIAFNGESKIIKSKCRFLLSHELRRNQFSVLLNNFENAAGIISVIAGGQTYEISYDKVLVGGQQIALPYATELSNGRNILITRTLNGVCYRLHKDLEVCCNEDSRSCSVALTRWFSGKVNGLLGTSNIENQHFEEDYWHTGECKLVNSQLKKPNEEAVKTCYAIFGNHRKAFFSNSFSLIKPNGWRSVCEHVLSNDAKGKCPLMRAFVYNAKLRSIEVDEPNECYSCQLGEQKFNIGQNVPISASNQFKPGTDYVFMILPCDSSYSLENLGKLAKKQQANKNNRIYLIKVGENEPSIVQDGNILNVDISKANLTQETTQQVSESSFKKALLLSSHLFAQRVASQRRLIIVSCGNCLDYSMINSIKTSRYLNDRNIIVTSWGKYEMTDLNNQDEATPETIIGYNADNVFLHKSENDEVETDTSDSYKVEHKGDLCHRLALKTDGNVFDISYIRDPKVLQQVVKKLEETKVSYKTTIKRCERVDTLYGDIDDFSIIRTREN